MLNLTKQTRMVHQRIIAEYLAGAIDRAWGADLAEAVGLSLNEFWDAAERCPWFTCFASGASGYTLTPVGMAALTETR